MPIERTLERIYAMAAKEAKHVMRDPRTLWLAIGMPVLLVIIFGFGVSFDLDHIPVSIVDLDHTAASRSLEEKLLASGELVLVDHPETPEAGELRLRERKAWVVLVLPRGLEDDLSRGTPVRVQALVDGADASTANQTITRLDGIGRATAAQLVLRKVAPPLQVQVMTRFNPENASAPFLVPGLMAYVLALVSVLLTALSVAREWERGSMEQLFATPVGRGEIIIGKLLPYVGLGMVQTVLVLAAGGLIFGVPMRGLVTVSLAAALFLAGMLGQGLLISVITRNQMVATQMGTFTSLLPSLLLSGFLFPIANMPWPLQWLSFVVPGRWFVALLRAVLLRGATIGAVWPNLVGLVGFALLMIVLSTARFQRRLG